jgi:hypothetical protein
MKIDHSFIFDTDAVVLAFLLFFFMFFSIYCGRVLGLRRFNSGRHFDASSTKTIISAMFGLLAFLLAFTFGMSGNRYDTRRGHIVEEANAIGTAILRADLYEDADRVEFRNDFKKYLEARIEYFEAAKDIPRVLAANDSAANYGKRLWDRAMKVSHLSGYNTQTMQMVPALNAMFDISTTRQMGELERVPDSIVLMLFVVSLASGFYLGYTSPESKIDWLVAIGFCLLTSVVVYITLDLDRPRRGFINLTASHDAMLQLRQLF